MSIAPFDRHADLPSFVDAQVVHRCARTLPPPMAAMTAQAWLRYGHPAPPRRGEADDLLDRFVPHCDVVERHHLTIAAPAPLAFDIACHQDLMALPIVRAIFTARQLVLGGALQDEPQPRGLVELTESLGWGVLAFERDREIVMGAVTRPWEANVLFCPVPPDDFASFAEPDYVKIAWTIRVDDIDTDRCILRTETRAVATDAASRAKFRRYWTKFSAGIVLIRWMSIMQTRCEAERQARSARRGVDRPPRSCQDACTRG